MMSSKLSQAGGKVERPCCTPLKEKLQKEDMDLDDSSEDEGMPDYKVGGYHPVHVGEVLNGRYVTV